MSSASHGATNAPRVNRIPWFLASDVPLRKHADPRVLGGMPSSDRGCIILRSVIDDDDFQIAPTLCGNALKCFIESAGSIVGGNYYGHYHHGHAIFANGHQQNKCTRCKLPMLYISGPICFVTEFASGDPAAQRLGARAIAAGSCYAAAGLLRHEADRSSCGSPARRPRRNGDQRVRGVLVGIGTLPSSRSCARIFVLGSDQSRGSGPVVAPPGVP